MNNNVHSLIGRYHSPSVQHQLELLGKGLRPIGRWLKTWQALALMLAFALLLSFYAVVSAVAKRADQHRALESQRAQAFWRCNALPLAQRPDCQATVISAPTTQRQGARPVRVADLQN